VSRVSAVLVTSLVLALGLGAGVAQAAAAPQVISNSPLSGSIAGGTSVTITGSGFTGATAVSFGGAAATSFVVSSDTSVVAVAPAHTVGVVDLNVTGSDGTVGTHANAFTYFQTPVVTAVSPSTSATGGGGIVTVTGTGFSGVTAVRFGAVAATAITVQSSTSLTATAPAGTGTLDVRVTTSAGGASATSAADQFSYIAAPAIATITPNAGPLGGGVTVTIKGARFSGATSVIFGVVAATSFAVVDDSTITAVAPSGAVGNYVVAITTPYGTNSGTPSSNYSIVAAPTVTALGTKTGSVAGGNTIGIGGTGFTTATAVYFGSTLATGLHVNSDTAVTAVAPAGSGTVDVTVVTAGGTSPTNATDTYTYVNAPAIASLSPAAGPTAGNTLVTITGSDLTGTTGVSFGGLAASNVTVVNASTVTALSPAGSVGGVNVTVSTAFGTSATNASDVFTYAVRPVVTSSSPSAGPVTGGTSVTIIGTGFTGATAVEFGTTPTTNFVVNSDTSITAISIAAVTGPGSTVNVTVDTPGGSALQVGTAIFRFAPIPTVTSVGPSSGSAAGGNTITITGTGLIPVSAVHFGSIAATSFTVGTGTSITATVPPGISGTVDVTVTTDGGTTATSAADQYRYISAPVVTALSSTTGPLDGGTLIVITGTDLAGTTAVDFGAVPATSFVVDNNTSLGVVVPAGTGTVDVTVTTAYGTSTTNAADQFTYVLPPTITGLSPTSGPTSGGTVVTISGTGFTPGNFVEFGASLATSVTVLTSTSMLATSPAGTAGTTDVTVTTGVGTSATVVADEFTYLPGPTIASVSPAFGSVTGGTPVTIAGTNFTGATSVRFGTSAAIAVTVVNATTITAHAPAGVTGIVDVVVTTPNGTTSANVSDRFTYITVPTVSSVSPSAGPVAGGNSVTIEGTGFTGTTDVHFGTASGTGVTVVSDSELTVTVPTGLPGAVDIAVTTAGGTSDADASDQYTFLAVPTLISLSPTAGPSTGGTTVTITGTGFTPDSTVAFGRTTVTTVTYLSGTDLTVVSPAGSGIVDVTVATAGGTSSTSLLDQFTFIAPPSAAPTITRVTPGTGSITGGTVVTITGTGFTGATSVTFGGVAAESFTVNSDTSITATAPAGTTGSADVVVTGAGGPSPAATFTYEPASTISIPLVLGATGMENPLPWLLLAATLLVLGVGLVVTRRRRGALS
jgi:LPXTG-motif cell wall-anchored protein